MLSMWDKLWHADLTQDEALEMMRKAVAEVRARLVVAPPKYLVKVGETMPGVGSGGWGATATMLSMLGCTAARWGWRTLSRSGGQQQQVQQRHAPHGILALCLPGSAARPASALQSACSELLNRG